MKISGDVFRTVLLLVSAGALNSAPVTLPFSGTIDNDPFGVFGSATFQGQYTFDSNTTQVLDTPNSGGYAGSGGIFNMSVVFNGTVGGALDGIPFVADNLNITVNNDFPGPLDQYLVTGTSTLNPNLTIEIALSDFTGTAFLNTLLPVTPLDLGKFSVASFALFGGTNDNPIEAEGLLATITTPEPANLGFTAAGLSLLAVWLRRKTRSRISF